MRDYLQRLLARAIDQMAQGGELKQSELPPLLLEAPKQREFGDLSTNFAMHWAKAAKKSPRLIAEAILKNLDDPEEMLARKEIAGPGFLNFTFAPKFYHARLRELVAGRDTFVDLGRGRRIQVEFASVNPTGPLHVGHGRVAVIGDVLARLHEATGFTVEREYYVNDAGNQMDNLALSLYARYCGLFGVEVEFPESGYPGDYVTEIAAEIKNEHGETFLRQDRQAALDFFRRYGGDRLLETIRLQLEAFGIRFDSFFSEKSLRERDEVARTLGLLRERGLLFTEDGAEWFRATAFGDDKDRPVTKSGGEPTYFAADIAYHRNKFERKFSELINVWGADHHGYVPRLKAAMKGLGYDSDALRVVLVQMVQLTRAGEPVRMGKRSGEFVALQEVVEEVGRDAARFFFLMRKSDSHLDFDLELAKRQSSDNPVFYVQYAHARVASVFEQARRSGLVWDPAQAEDIAVERLELPEEIELIRRMAQFDEIVEESVKTLEPHRIIFYLLELAGEFHRYYNRTRILCEDRELTCARLLLAHAVQLAVRRGLDLLGIDAPEKMALRSEPEA